MNTQFLADLGPAVLANGFNLIPLQPGQKRPVIKDWTKLEADRETLDGWIWEAPARGIGIPTKNTPAVDLDLTDEAVLAQLLRWCAEHLGDGPQRIGRPPRRLLLCRTDAPFRKMRSRAYLSPDGEKQQIEVLCDGQQFAAFGIHPGTGKPYAWQNGSPADTDAELLPDMTAETAAALIDFFESIVPADWEPVGERDTDAGERTSSDRSAPLDVVRSAMRHIRNDDLEYDDWVKVGLALRGAVGEDTDGEGRALWHEFSEQAGKYDVDYAEERWESFRPDKIGAGTLFHMAGEAGWTRPVPEAEEEFDMVDLDIGESPFAKQAADAALSKAAKAAKTERRLRAVSFSDAIAAALASDAEPLIDGLLDQTTLAALYGPSNVGKTFVALDISGAVASGREWNGRKATRGAVLYLAAEGGSGANKRLAALAKHHGLPSDTPLFLIPSPVDLFDPGADHAAVSSEAKRVAETAGLPVRLIVVDTLARAMAGGDENSGKDMGQLIRNVDAVREATKATVLIVHHTGKDAARGMRGHSSLLAALDTEIELESQGQGGVFRNGKQRDLGKVDDLRFTLRTVDLGKNAKGFPVRSCVVRWLSDFEDTPLDARSESLLLSLQSIGRPATTADWYNEHRRQRDADWMPGKPKPTGTSEQNLNKLRKTLIDAGRVTFDGNLYAPENV